MRIKSGGLCPKTLCAIVAFVLLIPVIPMVSAAPPGPPVITTADVTDATEDVYYSVDYEATDPNGDAVTWTLWTDCDFLSIASSTGVLSGTPRNDDIGTWTVEVTADDGKGGSDSHNFTVTVSNTPPSILTDDITTATEDVLYYSDYVSDEYWLGPVTWSLWTDCDFLEIYTDANKHGILSGTPDNTDIGAWTVNVTVDDGNGEIDWSNFTLTVQEPITIITPDVETAVEGEWYHNDYDSNMDGPPIGIQYTEETGPLGIPTAGYGTYLVAGRLPIEQGISNVSGIEIFLNALPSPPQDFVLGVYSDNGGVPDSKLMQTVTVSSGTAFERPPGSGRLVISADVDLAPSPQVNLPVGDYHFVYWCTNCPDDMSWLTHGTDAGGYSSHVCGTGVAGSCETAVWPNMPLSFGSDSSFLEGYSAVIGDLYYSPAITWSLETNVDFLTINDTGNLSGTPDNTDLGSWWVNVTADDGYCVQDWTNFTLDVYPAPTHLSFGLNYISISKIQADTTIETVLSSIAGQYNRVIWYDGFDSNDHWKVFTTYKPGWMNDLTDIDHTMGLAIWITDPEGADFTPSGTDPTAINNNISLSTGWNLVGFPSLANEYRNNSLNNLEVGIEIDNAYHFDSSEWVEMTPVDKFEVGKAYWLHANQDCMWDVPI